VAWEHGKILLLVNTKSQPELKEAAVERLLERQAEGVIYATMYHRPVEPPSSLREVPTVLLDCYIEDRSLPSVVPDEVRGGREATQYLVEKGHRRIGFINNVDPIPATIGRLQGYKDALEAYQLPYDETLVCEGSSVAEGGYHCAQTLMKHPDPPTAIFCFNDRIAMGAYDALRKLDLRIPEDVAVMGFDNQELIAAHLYPPLSTMELPHYQMGQWAANYLIEQIGSETQFEPKQQVIECPLVERDST
jgi:LacI family transcriptional regulator